MFSKPRNEGTSLTTAASSVKNAPVRCCMYIEFWMDITHFQLNCAGLAREKNRLTAIFCDPDVIVRVRSVPSRQHHELCRHTAVVKRLEDV